MARRLEMNGFNALSCQTVLSEQSYDIHFLLKAEATVNQTVHMIKSLKSKLKCSSHVCAFFHRLVIFISFCVEIT